MFYLTECSNVCSYAEDTTFYACGLGLKDLVRLEHDLLLAIERFQANYRKLNERKCHLLTSEHKHGLMSANKERVKCWKEENMEI